MPSGAEEQREQLRQQAEALNELNALLDRVEAHSKYLLSIPAYERSALQNLWVMGYASIELKLATGNEELLRETGLDLLTLDRFREMTTVGYVPQEGGRAKFSLFSRRR